MRGFLADKVGARREGLAKLDRSGTDRLECGGIVGYLRLDRAEPCDAARVA